MFHVEHLKTPYFFIALFFPIGTLPAIPSYKLP
jgi:hypothetical protein